LYAFSYPLNALINSGTNASVVIMVAPISATAANMILSKMLIVSSPGLFRHFVRLGCNSTQWRMSVKARAKLFLKYFHREHSNEARVSWRGRIVKKKLQDGRRPGAVADGCRRGDGRMQARRRTDAGAETDGCRRGDGRMQARTRRDRGGKNMRILRQSAGIT